MPLSHSKKVIRTFALVSFLNDFGADMVHALWPAFLTQVLGVNMVILGLIDGVGEALVSISQAVSGYFSDRIHRRKIFIWLGYLMSAVSRIGYAFAMSWPVAFVSKIVERSGKMRDAPRDAVAADLSNHHNRGGNFGILRTMDNLGALCGALAAIVLIRYLPMRTIFLYAAIPSIIGAILILIFIREHHNGFRLYEGLHWKNLSASYKWFVLLNGIFSIGTFSYSFLLIFAQKFGFALATLPLLYLIYMAAATVSSYPFGRMADAVGRRLVILMGFVFWAATLATLLLSQDAYGIFISFVFFGLSKGALEAAQKAFVTELAPTHFRASALGTFKLVDGLTALPASVIAGELWERFGAFAPFHLSLVLTAIAAVMLVFVDGR